jgi:probable phosphoglycerate mutase
MRLIFMPATATLIYVNDCLTEKGEREAALLARRYRDWPVDRVYCSPLGRAKATCGACVAETGAAPVICDWLREFWVRVDCPEVSPSGLAWDFLPRYFTREPDLYAREGWLSAPTSCGTAASRPPLACRGRVTGLALRPRRCPGRAFISGFGPFPI